MNMPPKNINKANELTHPLYRSDIDGLRAIAVLAVIFYHAFPDVIKSGFVGVDVFFVISGYLISLIIFKSIEKSGFDFLVFYSRRINRLFPSLLLVLASFFTLGWFTLLTEEYAQLGKHIAAGSAFVSNFVLWNESGYFDNTAETKPLLHLWSLAIEEQFYIVWPIVACFFVKTRWAIYLICCLLLLSLSFNIYTRHDNLIALFYSPATRFWELLIGSLLAYIELNQSNKNPGILKISPTTPNNQPLSKHIYNNEAVCKNILSFIGLLLIITGFILIDKQKTFPGIWAIFPTFGTALIIGAGKQAWFNKKILSNKTLVGIGLISFPLYLWHWPLLSFARTIEAEEPSPEIRIILLLVSAILAWFTFKAIEKPLINYRSSKKLAGLLLSFMAITGTIGYAAFQNNGFPSRTIAKTVEKKAIGLKAHKPIICYDENYDAERWPYYTEGFCNETNDNKDIDFILWGDSHSEHLFYGLKELGSDINFMLIGRTSCPPIIEDKTWRGQYFDDKCKAVNQSVLKYSIEDSDASIVIISSLGSFYFEPQGFAANHKNISFASEYETARENGWPNRKEIFESGLNAAVSSLIGAGKQVVLIKDVPEFPIHPKACLQRPLKLNISNCDLSRQDYEKRSATYRQILNDIKSKHKDVYIFDAAAIFCDKELCKSGEEHDVYFRDGHHLNYAGSLKVAERLIPFLKSLNTSTMDK